MVLTFTEVENKLMMLSKERENFSELLILQTLEIKEEFAVV